MHPELNRTLHEIDTADWKEIAVEYGRENLRVRVPPNCTILSMKEIPFIADPRKAVEEALSHPIGSPPLEAIIRTKGKPAAELRAAVTVSDITRPVPYTGEGGILRPLLDRLEAAGIPRKQHRDHRRQRHAPAEHRRGTGRDVRRSRSSGTMRSSITTARTDHRSRSSGKAQPAAMSSSTAPSTGRT